MSKTTCGNVISDVRRGHYGAWGLYFDSRAGDYRAERNWCYATDDGGFFKNQGWDIRVVGNRFEDCTTSQLGEESLYSPDSLLFASNYVTWASPATCCRGHELRPEFCKVFDNYFHDTKESPASEADAVKAGYRPFEVDAGRRDKSCWYE